ncbi:hypothetical protein O181_013642 [Austropuccinia psidii MF-1]|uniref:Uncharacterized protein n=1 Tax=Austropuccinia psidii MF-1 TaxID=1389203 RepID=A0A9Q3C032_9BASI|nr:hypothetical protein [Austropuccinia psidii MF-1]
MVLVDLSFSWAQTVMARICPKARISTSLALPRSCEFSYLNTSASPAERRSCRRQIKCYPSQDGMSSLSDFFGPSLLTIESVSSFSALSKNLSQTHQNQLTVIRYESLILYLTHKILQIII